MSLFKSDAPAHKIAGSWSGLGAWNLYFLAKFLLAWTGHLNIQILPNLIFAAVLLIPIANPALRRLRTLIAIPVAVALLYQDTWFPPFSRLLAQPGVLNFSFDYIVELLGRFIDWQVCALLLLLFVGYLFLNQWLRLTTLTLLGFAWLGMGNLQWLLPPSVQPQMAGAQTATGVPTVSAGEPDDATLNGYLEKFYLNESTRKVEFKEPAVKPPPFDLLVINICSMAWDDLDAVGFDDLRKLGFSNELMLNHTGEFDGFLQEVREQGQLPPPALGVVPAGLPRTYVGFDGSPIWRDRDVLSKWWQHRMTEDSPNMALFYNTTSLHDGNRQVQSDGGTQAADYRSRAQILLDDLNAFLKELEKSGRRVVVAIVPEHGAALHGDRMQIAGMREIPSDSITHVPVGIKLINMGDNAQTQPIHVSEPSSYLAVAEIIARLYADPALSNGQTVDWSRLLTDLPKTAKVSENSGTVVLDYNGKPYVRIKENGGWLPYPQRFK